MSNYNSPDLAEIYSKLQNPECQGCSILNQSKPFHCWKDYKESTTREVDVLFLTESHRYNGWEKSTLSEGEEDLFNEFILPLLNGIKYAVSPSVKCPTVKEIEMNATNMKICRKYVDETVKEFNPKLIIPMGNLAFKMLTKKSGIKKHHGSEFRFNEIPVVPTFALANIFFEEKLKETIPNDIKIAIGKFIHKNTKPVDLKYKVIESLADIQEFIWLSKTVKPIAFDTETTGLNLLTDQLLTLAISWQGDKEIESICVPIMHRESKIKPEELHLVLNIVKSILENPLNIKIGQNVKFDFKWLTKFGIRATNLWDTKSMALLVDENQGVGLGDMVKNYFPESMEVL